MSAILLLAGNFVREQRLVLILMSTWIIVFAGLFAFISDANTRPEELEVFYRQELAYGIAIGVFSGASIVHKERRSRRILAVLSKGIHRVQYLAGVLLGIACVTAMYYGLVAAANSWLIHQMHFEGGVLTPAIAGWLATQLATVIGLAFGTFLPPLIAAVCAALVSALGMAIPAHPHVFPVSQFLRSAVFATYADGLRWNGYTGFASAVTIQTAIVFTIAAWIFRRRDITVAVE